MEGRNGGGGQMGGHLCFGGRHLHVIPAFRPYLAAVTLQVKLCD